MASFRKKSEKKKGKAKLGFMIPYLIDGLDTLDDSLLQRMPEINEAVQKHRKKKAENENKDKQKDSQGSSHAPTFKIRRLENSSTNADKKTIPKPIKIRRFETVSGNTDILLQKKKNCFSKIATDLPGPSQQAIKTISQESDNEVNITENEVMHTEEETDIDSVLPESTGFFDDVEQPTKHYSSSSMCFSDFDLEVNVPDSLSYQLELRKSKYLMTLDNHFTAVIVPDFNIQKKSLKDSQFVIIKRRSLLSGENKFVWVYSCSCSPFDGSIIDSLDSANALVNETSLNFSLCLHIEATKSLIEELSFHLPPDDVPFSSVSEDEITVLSFSPTRLVVVCEGSIGVIGARQGHVRCLSCCSVYCEHVIYLKEQQAKDKDNDVLKEFADYQAESITTPQITKIHRPVSTQRIRFEPDPRGQFCLRTPVEQYLNHSKRLPSILICVDEWVNKCRDCGGNLEVGDYEMVNLLTMTNVFSCEVYSKKCPDCLLVYLYDGESDSILNMGKLLIHHSVLRDYMLHFLHGNSCTLISFYEIWKISHKNAGNIDFKSYLTPTFWRHSWYGFLKLVDYDIADAATCLTCGAVPNVVVCDATSLGFQRKFSTAALQEYDLNTPAIPKYSDHSRRIAVPSRSTREQLLLYVTNRLGKAAGIDFLLKLEFSHKPIFTAVKWISDVYRINSLPKPFIEFFRCLSSSSPVCSYVYPSQYCCELILRLCDDGIKGNVEILRALQSDAPIFYNLLHCLEIESCLPESFKGLLIYLCDLSMAPFSNAMDIKTSNLRPDSGYARFPNLPKVRERGFFQQDKEAFKNCCRKAYTGHPRLLPGIFTVYCVHGICYGYQVMENQESPNVPFTIFKTRFPKAPKTIIYDNACGLHAYCLNRDPIFFQKTIFLVDRFHWKNHTGCAPSYNINIYANLKDVNSEINEQQNSSTKKLKTQLSYMNSENFMLHCDFYLWYRNKLKNSKFHQ